ncbi:hypothetical protein [Rubrivirga sp.]|uniref:hypothetical protein n=1 Tax=Rubrivirga sp. TaxID=1885344 RepID=UPI003C758CEE
MTVGRSPALADGTAVGSSGDSADAPPKPERWRLRSACSGGLAVPEFQFERRYGMGTAYRSLTDPWQGL